MTERNLPFKIGQIVETRSSLHGYRGAWFQCKILDTTTQKTALHYKLQYLDYADERIHVTKVFQKYQGGSEKTLMIRPKYPPHYHESETLKIKSDREPLLVIHDSWKVGDLVDWWCDSCFWTGTILELKGNDELEIELLPKPFGQGGTYKALCKDLRPSLEWSLENGWKVSSSMDGQNRQCAKLIKQKNEDQVDEDVCKTEQEQAVVEAKEEQREEREPERQTEGVAQLKTEGDIQKMEGDGDLLLNIMQSDSIEAAVLDLEELIVRIEWLQGMLRPDVKEGETSQWKYEDYCPSSARM